MLRDSKHRILRLSDASDEICGRPRFWAWMLVITVERDPILVSPGGDEGRQEKQKSLSTQKNDECHDREQLQESVFNRRVEHVTRPLVSHLVQAQTRGDEVRDDRSGGRAKKSGAKGCWIEWAVLRHFFDWQAGSRGDAARLETRASESMPSIIAQPDHSTCRGPQPHEDCIPFVGRR